MTLTSNPESTRHAVGARLQVLTWEGSDAELLELLQSGAPQSAAKLYDRFNADVNRVVFRLLGPDLEHDDLVQEAFLRVIRNVQQVRDPSKLNSWVVSVTVNVVMSELKKRRLRRWLLAEKSGLDASLESTPDPEARQLLRSVFSVLDAMPVPERTVFALRYLDERTLQEVAAIVGHSVPTTKRALAKAEKRFQTLAARLNPELLKRFRSASLGAVP